MEELIKTLMDAPDKFKSAIIWLARVVMGCMLTSAVWIKLFGPYHLINLLDWPDWVTFFLSGRVFICLLFYIICDQFLFGLLNVFSYLFFKAVSSIFYWLLKGAKGMKAVIRVILRSGELLDIDDRTGKAKLMDRSEDLYETLVQFNAKGGRSEMVNYRDSFLTDIGHTFFVFAVIYFFLMPAYPHHKLLSYLIIGSLVVVAFLYSSIHLLFDVIKKAGPELADMVAFAKLTEASIKVFMSQDLYVHERDFRNKETHQCFHFYGKYILLDFTFDRIRCRPYRIEKAIKSAQDLGCFSIVFTNRPVDLTAMEIATANSSWILLIEIASEEDATKKIAQLVEEKFSRPVLPHLIMK
jgi:hypothetical protein